MKVKIKDLKKAYKKFIDFSVAHGFKTGGIDRYNNTSTNTFNIEKVNPNGEIELIPYDILFDYKSFFDIGDEYKLNNKDYVLEVINTINAFTNMTNPHVSDYNNTQSAIYSYISYLVGTAILHYKYKYASLIDRNRLKFNPLYNVDGETITTNVYGIDKNTNVYGEELTTIDTDIRKSTTNNPTVTNTNSINAFNSGTDTETGKSVTNYTQGTVTSDATTDMSTRAEHTDTTTRDSRTDTITEVRRGNIGLTKSTELLRDYSALYDFDLIEILIKDIIYLNCKGF